MEVLEAIRTRRSIRSFKSESIPDEYAIQILEAARWAPSSGNRQPWTFIYINDPEILRMVKNCSPGFYGHAAAAIVIGVKDEKTTLLRGLAGSGPGGSLLRGGQARGHAHPPARGEWAHSNPYSYPAHAHTLALTVLHLPENRGVSAARNAGAAVAKDCHLLAFIDSDDLWPADYLQRMAVALEQSPRAVAASCDRAEQFDNQPPGRPIHLDQLSGTVTARMFRFGPPGTPNTVFRASAFQLVGGYCPDQPCAEDYQLMLRLSLQGPWQHVPGRPVLVRKSTNPADQLSKQRSDRRYHLARV